MPGADVGVFVGAIALGAVHGFEPGHGWPVAAAYALDRSNKWIYGFAASLIIGIGHLISSVAMVGAFFLAKDYFDLTQLNEPISISARIQIGGPISLAAGLLLILLGVREYRLGHTHSHGNHDHDDSGSHVHDDGNHHHDHETHRSRAGSARARIGRRLSRRGSHHHDFAEPTDRGLWGIAWFAFILGFAHEEEFEIIALCAGSVYCLELMTLYALTVIAGIVSLTLVLIAGYQRAEDRVRRLTPYLPLFSAVVLVVMGVGFVIGLL